MGDERAAGQTLVHEAMAARFSVQVAHDPPRYARQAVCAAFAQLDMLERQLSRFVEGSDVWRINRLRPGETAVVALDTFHCLALAMELQQRTGGAFDVTYRSQSTSLPAERNCPAETALASEAAVLRALEAVEAKRQLPIRAEDA